jgi:Mycobacterium membrane protein
VPKIAVADTAKRIWIVLVIAVVIAVAAFCVLRLRSFFGNHDTSGIGNSSLDDIKPFNPKHVVYKVYGSGATANINYLDINAQPRRADNVPLPWTLSVTTTLPSVSVNVVAQTDGDEISCQIIVNDVVKDERSITGVNAETFCIVKSA